MSYVSSWKVVEEFEERMAAYCGAPHAVAVDTCTAAIFLCLKLLSPFKISIPCRTYLGVACAAKHAGIDFDLVDRKWQGEYWLMGSQFTEIVDSACRLKRGMYGPNYSALVCLSFQYRKHLKIGRGGMVLTDDKDNADWLRKARFCGRAEHNGKPEFVGWHCFMEPERAARGLVLMDSLPDDNPDLVFEYPDLKEYSVLK